jgi:protein-tyrosine phosphatase
MLREYRFSGLWNLRDLGGHRTVDGCTTRWGLLYRSDSLHGLTDDDREPFGRLGIRTVIDLRRVAEVAMSGRVPDWTRATWRHLPFRHREWEETPYEEGADLAEYLIARYTDMAAVGAADVAEALRIISHAESAPVVIHCVVGKDRTGIVSGLTLAALGVPDDAIAAEYAMTAPNLAPMAAAQAKEARRQGREPPLPPLPTPAAAMLGFLREIRARYGKVEDYLAQSGFGPESVSALRANLLDSKAP